MCMCIWRLHDTNVRRFGIVIQADFRSSEDKYVIL